MLRLLDFGALPVGMPFYEFVLAASDKSSSATTIIRIRVQNANVNEPVIVPLPKLTIYRQQLGTNLPIAQVAASDKDGSEVTFYFVDSSWLIYGF